jgi:hypothetical protein
MKPSNKLLQKRFLVATVITDFEADLMYVKYLTVREGREISPSSCKHKAV